MARISRSGYAIEIRKPMKTPKKITFIILSNLARKSPIMDPIFEIDRSTPDRNMDKPKITPIDPRIY